MKKKNKINMIIAIFNVLKDLFFGIILGLTLNFVVFSWTIGLDVAFSEYNIPRNVQTIYAIFGIVLYQFIKTINEKKKG